MTLSEAAKTDVTWWIDNALGSRRKINHGVHDILLQTDASLHGWGAWIELVEWRTWPDVSGMAVQMVDGSSQNWTSTSIV